MCIFFIILDFKLFEQMISLQKEKEKDDKQLEEVSWHGFVVLVVLYHSLVRELIIFAEKRIFFVFIQAQRKISQQQTEIDVSSWMYAPFCVKC